MPTAGPDLRDAVVARLLELAVRLLELEPGEVAETSAFDDLGLDSLTVVEYALRLEDVFDVELPEEEVTGTQTFGGLADVVLEKVQARATG